MTAQIPDTVRYENANYSIAGIDGEGLFDPWEHGMQPISWSTACWHGFTNSYAIENGQLFLTSLEICLTEPTLAGLKHVRKVKAPLLNGHAAKDVSREEDSAFEYRYENLCLPVPFSGGLLLDADFLWESTSTWAFMPLGNTGRFMN
jgi:hypothetical protein